MKKKTKISIIIASILVVVGSVMFCTSMAKSDWDFTILSLVKYETNTYHIDGDFKNISIDSKLDNITFVKSDSKECKIVCREMDKVKHFAKVENETLKIGTVDERKWYEYIGINAGSPKVTVYLSENEYNSLDIECTTGLVEIPKDFNFGNMNIKVTTGEVKCMTPHADNMKIKSTTGNIIISDSIVNSMSLAVTTGNIDVRNIKCSADLKTSTTTGDVILKNIECENIISEATTGDVSLENVIAASKLRIETDTGDVTMDDSDANDIHIETDTGDVTGSLLSDKIFIVETDTGDVDVPKTTSGGICEIKSDTGDVKITIK